MTDTSQPPINDTKPWYASKTVWAGGLATAAPLVAILLHKAPPDAAAIDNLAALLAALCGSVAGLAAIYGRLKASTTIAKS